MLNDLSPSVKNIERMRGALGLGVSDFADLMEMGTSKYWYYLLVKRDIPAHSLYLLSERVNVSVKRMLLGQFDPEAARRHFFGDDKFLPMSQTQFAFSKVRTIEAALNFTARRFHPTAASSIRKDFQLPLGLREDLDRNISISVLNGIFEDLESSGACNEDYYRIGQTSSASYLKSKLGENLSQYRGKKAFWEAAFAPSGGHIELVDKNFIYELLEVTSEKAVLKMTSREWAREVYKCSNYGHKGFAFNGAGFTSGLGVAYNGRHCTTKVLKCFAMGDSHNLFEINFG